MQQTEVIQNHENEHVRVIGQGDTRQKIQDVKLCSDQVYNSSSD
jgi:hypothetical protein